MQRWIIVHPSGDETLLGMRLAFDYEYDDWKRASRNDWEYDDKEFARQYGRDLAKRHGLKMDDSLKVAEDFYLD